MNRMQKSPLDRTGFPALFSHSPADSYNTNEMKDD